MIEQGLQTLQQASQSEESSWMEIFQNASCSELKFLQFRASQFAQKWGSYEMPIRTTVQMIMDWKALQFNIYCLSWDCKPCTRKKASCPFGMKKTVSCSEQGLNAIYYKPLQLSRLQQNIDITQTNDVARYGTTNYSLQAMPTFDSVKSGHNDWFTRTHCAMDRYQCENSLKILNLSLLFLTHNQKARRLCDPLR